MKKITLVNVCHAIFIMSFIYLAALNVRDAYNCYATTGRAAACLFWPNVISTQHNKVTNNEQNND